MRYDVCIRDEVVDIGVVLCKRYGCLLRTAGTPSPDGFGETKAPCYGHVRQA